MRNHTEVKNCPVCGRDVYGSEHSRMGECASPEGTVEYWACFLAQDVFSVDNRDSDEEV